MCFKCDEPGHKAQFCPRKMKKEEGFFCSSADGEESSSIRDAKRRKVSEDDDESFLENAVALTSDTFASDESVHKNNSSDEWYIDSAASIHMTYDQNNLMEYKTSQLRMKATLMIKANVF